MTRAAADLLGELGLDEQLLRSLDRLGLRLRRPLPGGGAPGRRRAAGSGASVEFADFRSYVPGDDVRRIDWNAYARSDRLTLRLHVAEEDATVNVVIDRSASMEWGEPVSKAALARSLAAALIWMALRSEDRACVIGIADTVLRRSPAVRGSGSASRLWEVLCSLPTGGGTDPRALVAAARGLRPGATVVLSDFMTESSWEPAVRALRAARQEVTLIQVLSPEEVDPELAGDLRLRDLETGAVVEVTVTPDLLREHRRALDAHTERLAAAAAAHRGSLVRVLTTSSLSDALLGDLRRSGVVQ